MPLSAEPKQAHGCEGDEGKQGFYWCFIHTLQMMSNLQKFNTLVLVMKNVGWDLS